MQPLCGKLLGAEKPGVSDGSQPGRSGLVPAAAQGEGSALWAHIRSKDQVAMEGKLPLAIMAAGYALAAQRNREGKLIVPIWLRIEAHKAVFPMDGRAV